MNNIRKLLSALLLIACSLSATADHDDHRKKAWIDSVYNSLTPQQRLGQLFMVAAYSNRDEKHYKEIDSLVYKYNLGGLIFMQGGPLRQAILNNRYQALAKTPLMIAIDGEWGLSMRLDSTTIFPRQMTLGALNSPDLVYKMGEEIARQCKRIGIHINFAPVIDINSNPANPVIGMRSFGEDKKRVSEYGMAYMKGMQDNGVMACVKHFPGHGDTDTDSHLALPVINHDKKRLDDIELYPFRKLFEAGAKSVMVAHIHLPVYDNAKNKATTLSKNVVTNLLKHKLGYEGLIFTDALNMKGVSSFYKPGEVDVKALIAGNDVLLFSEDVPTAIAEIEKAIKDEDISEKEIEKRIYKILEAKYWFGLHNYQPIELTNLYEDLNKPWSKILRQQLYENAITLVRNEKNILPVTLIDTVKLATVSIGLTKNNKSKVRSTINKYLQSAYFEIDYDRDSASYNNLTEYLSEYNTVIVNLHNVISSRSKNWGISWRSTQFIKKLQETKQVIVVVYGNPYSLKLFENSPTVIAAYEDNDATQTAAMEAIFGAIKVKGQLPISASSKLPAGIGYATNSVGRVKITFPEKVGLNSKVLQKIDTIALQAIRATATPGCQVLVIKDSNIVYNKSFGHLSYDKKNEVTEETVYDIASITKVAATTLTTMFLVEHGLLDVNKTASEYLPELMNTNKKHLIIRDIMLHQAGLQPYLEHWRKTKDGKELSEYYYCNYSDERFSIQVLPNLYALRSIEDSLWYWSIKSDLLPLDSITCRYGYKYSDIGFYIMKRICEKITNQPIDELLMHNFYHPLGLTNIGYLAYCRVPNEKIAPTENDTYFRNTLVCGTVHDQGAAMTGGVAGHAGLFSNATDLGILMQMLLQKGYYGGATYFREQTIQEFTRRDLILGRRGLGWDKPILGEVNNTSSLCSPSTFGHTGFTGTAVWADPKYNLIYVFLSNRVHPNAENKKLITMDIRTKIHDVIYESMQQTYVPKINWQALECDYVEPVQEPKKKPVQPKSTKKKKKR